MLPYFVGTTLRGRIRWIGNALAMDRKSNAPSLRQQGVKSWLRLGNVAQSSGCESRLGNRKPRAKYLALQVVQQWAA